MPHSDGLSGSGPRKPRLALMGEFSAGKSTLTNLLVGRQPLPVQVTATRLPPVWISHGPEAASVVAADGSETPVPVDDLGTVPIGDAALIRLSLPAEALELCDLIDMPGISDPNMPSSVWQNVLPEADSVIWCTHATQAWRQSEAAVWADVSGRLADPGILLVTHFDKLRNSRDRDRVLKRLAKETGDAFGAVFPISLSQALAAGEDMEAWKSCGADRFVEYLVDLLVNWDHADRAPVPDRIEAAPQTPPDVPEAQTPQLETPAAGVAENSEDQAAEPASETVEPPCAAPESRVMPRRVKAEKRSKRPERRPAEL